jgi:hypothetical protein
MVAMVLACAHSNFAEPQALRRAVQQSIPEKAKCREDHNAPDFIFGI